MFPVLPTLIRALVLITLTLLVGGFAFNAFVLHGKVTAALREAIIQRRRAWLLLLVGLAAVVSVFDFAVRAQLATPQTVLQAMVRLAPFGVLGWLLITAHDDSVFALAVCALALLNQSLTSHAAFERDPLLPLAADWVHITFVSLWLGGVGYIAAVIVPVALPRSELLSGLGASVAKFSPLATMCVLVIALTGLIQGTTFVVSLDALVGTSYGRALIVKLIIFAVLIAFGAFHQFVVGPKLNAWRAKAGSQAEAARRFRLSITAEMAVSLLALIAAAAMTVLPLARDALR